METRTALTLAEQFAAACDWWRDAGVDHDYNDEAAALLKPPETPQQALSPAKKQAAEPVAEKPKMGGDRSSWPQSLEDFTPWWLGEASLDGAGIGARIAPRGVKDASLMVLVPMPEAGDGDTLLSGKQGQLVANMLRAMGIAPEAAYIAAALPRHMPHADWDALLASGMGDIVLHHIALAAPRRLLVLGRDVLQLLGQEKRQGVQELPLNGAPIQLLASFGPENLLQNARLRADLWRRWLEWTGNQ